MSKRQKYTRQMRRLPIVVALVALGLMATSLAWARNDWDDQAAKRKAEYIFLESQSAYGTENYGTYATLVERAYQLDSTDRDIAAEWGFVQLVNPDLDSVTSIKAYRYLRDQFYANPTDYNAGVTVAGYARGLAQYGDMLKIWATLDSLNPTNSAPAEELARSYLVMYLLGDSAAYDKALAIYDKLETGTGMTIQLSTQKMNAYLLKNDTVAIISELEQLRASAPSDTYNALFVGQTYEFLQDRENALKYYDQACQLDSTNGQAYMARANLYSQTGDSVAYDREVFHALRSHNLDLDSKLDILHKYVAKLYSDPAQEPRIRQLFGELQQMHASEPDIHQLFGSYLYTIKDYKGAAEQASYTIDLEPSDETAWSTLVQMYSLNTDTAKMITAGTEAMAKFPDNLYFPMVVAAAYRMQDQLDEAIAVLDSVKINNVNNPTAVANFESYRGDMYALAQDTAKALQAYDKAILYDPDNYMALNNAAYFMAQNDQDLAKAEQYISRVIRAEKNNPTYLDTYAWVLFKKKDYSMAKIYIDMTVNLYETQGASTDTIDNAESVIEEIEDIEMPSAEIYEHAGDIYFMNGDPEQALVFWKKALALLPDNELLQRKVKHKTYFFK